MYGKEEVFAPEIERFAQMLKRARTLVSSHGEDAGVHAWPVASMFVSDADEKRLKGLNRIVSQMKRQIPPSKMRAEL